MKRPGEPTTLTLLWWHGEPPVPGDVLKTKTGRRYLILEQKGRRQMCVVMRPEERSTGLTFDFEWAKRERRAA